MKSFSQIAIALMTMSSVAIAQPKSDKAAPPAKETKPAMPTVPAELTAFAKVFTGTWKCKGESVEHDGSKVAITATNRTKLDLDKWWLTESVEVKGMKMGSYKMTTFTTYDATSKKWRRLAMDNFGSQMVGTADATPMGQPMVFNLDSLGPMGSSRFRDHIDASDLKAGLEVWGELSTDKGKSWNKIYEMTCKK